MTIDFNHVTTLMISTAEAADYLSTFIADRSLDKKRAAIKERPHGLDERYA
jgi:hypothetical protein